MAESVAVEICVDSVESCIAAQAGGATRVELCANLFEGGTTPSAGIIREARKNISIGLHVILRPRGGDFCYSDSEFESICYDLQLAKDLGADGVVIGVLQPDGHIDKKRMARLVELARPMKVTLHRAFDMTPNPLQALEDSIALGIDLILTSGQERSAVEGIPLLKQLVQVAQGRIRIMAGGGVSERNVRRILQETGVQDVHLSGRRRVESSMEYRQEHVFMGGDLRLPEYTRFVADAEKIAKLTGLIAD
ncbi:copper homeostasis protein CutC [Pontibacter sp. SGAir0037]|nr:copper homeostasis protein CutC [Pontibacter sp. SGAir0037]